MILFRKLRWKNLLSTGNQFTELNLNETQTTLVVGENGTGKSTILDAISFVLFGKPFRKVNKPQLLNSITQKGLLVEVEFSIGSNHYVIRRGMRPNVFEVYQNDVLLNQSAEMRDYQATLEKQILKVNHKSFCQVVILGSATFLPFMQLNTYQRREIIEDLLDLQIFTTMNTILKNKVLSNTERRQDANYRKKLAEERLKLVSAHLAELQNNQEQMIDEKQRRIEDANNQLEILNGDLLGTMVKIGELVPQVADQETLQKKLNKLKKLEHQIEAKLDILKKEVNFFQKHDDCPTCKQPIDSKFKCETVETKTHDIEEINKGLDKLTAEYNEVNAQLKEIMRINTILSELNLEQHRLNSKLSSTQEYINTLEHEITHMKKTNDAIDFSKIAETEAELADLEKEYLRLIEEQNTLAAASTLLKDGGIKARIIKQYIPIINKLINKYLSAMEFMCQFELNEEFNETIKSRFRDEFSYASFSEGEKQKIDVSLLFTWRAVAKLRNSINTNLLIFDEILDSSLDSNSIEYFLSIIQGIAHDSNIFIISHREGVSEKFEKTIRFEKFKSFSRIVN